MVVAVVGRLIRRRVILELFRGAAISIWSQNSNSKIIRILITPIIAPRKASVFLL